MEQGVGLKSLNDPLDTTTSQDGLVFNLFASLAEFERDLIRERTACAAETLYREIAAQLGSTYATAACRSAPARSSRAPASTPFASAVP